MPTASPSAVAGLPCRHHRTMHRSGAEFVARKNGKWNLWRPKKRRLTGIQIEDMLLSLHGDESIDDETIRTVHSFMMKRLPTAHVTARLRPQPPVEPPPGWLGSEKALGSERAMTPIGMSPNQARQLGYGASQSRKKSKRKCRNKS